ncbi:MAG: pilus assembly protein PilX [Desulfuromonadaceae bacterium]|nr:pilus assembly protein PilX [Desulfuromonadaceae bacterium]
MKLLSNNQGVVLITTLMLTLIAFAISMVMLYMVMQGIQLSGASRQYKNTLEAAAGGVDIVTKDAIPYLVGAAGGFVDGTSAATYFKDTLTASMPGLNATTLTVIDNKCLNAKLTKKVWGTDCADASLSLNAKESPDIRFDLKSQISASATGYRVYTKIVSTTPGNTDMSGRNLEGEATTGAPGQDVGAPYVYRIEVTGEKVSNPKEKANLSLLYAY